ncbi:MAG: flippase [Eubacterium sp.]|nr:flippase [Eubacterium sp.]
MKEKSIKLNAALNVIKTLTSLLFPLITYSYAARVLMPEGMGRFNFSNSIVSYFALLAGLGVATYAVREGAKIREQEDKIRVFSSNVFSINVYATIFAYLLLILSFLTVPKLQSYTTTILLLSLQIVLTTHSAYWVCNIYEEYSIQTILTITAQIAALALLFLFVHTENDLNIYALITVIAYSGSGLILHVYARKYVKFRFVLKPDLSHLRRILIIFSTSIAATIYISSDITILGWIAGDRYTGLYGASANIYKIVKQLLNAIVAVVVPRFAFYLGTDQYEKLQKLGNALMDYMITICLPTMVGLFFMSRPIIEVIAGRKFTEAAGSLRLLSIALVFAIFANFFANCVLLAYRKEMTVMIATIISAAVNILLNLVLIPRFYDRAAAVTTIAAEAVMCGIVWFYSQKEVRIRAAWRNVVPVLAGCAAIAGICMFVQRMLNSSILILAVGIPVSVAVYGGIQILMKNMVAADFLKNRGKGI